MKLSEAKRLIELGAVERDGFRVSFERRSGGMLTGDYFPDRDEMPIATESGAWNLAACFGMYAPEEYVNIYVIRADNFAPVPGYRDRMMRQYPRWSK